MSKKIMVISIIIIGFFTLSNNAFASNQVLCWDVSPGNATGYTIYYGTSLGNYSMNKDVGSVTQYSLDNFALTEGTTYYFTVQAYNSALHSSNSNVVVYTVPETIDTTPPVFPRGVSGIVDHDNILLTWQNNTEQDLAGYRIYYGTESRDYGLPVSVNTNQYIVPGLDTGVLYYFAVTAIDISGNESGYSSPEITMTIPEENDNMYLIWDASGSSSVSGYIIFYGSAPGDYTEEIDVGNVTRYSLKNIPLTKKIKYYFVVRAYNKLRQSDNSNRVTYIPEE